MRPKLDSIDTAEEILRYPGVTALRSELSDHARPVGAALFASNRLGPSVKPGGVGSHAFGYRCRGARTTRIDKPSSFKGRVGLPGMSSFVAADESCTWECDGPHDMVVFFLDAEFLRSLATEAHDIGPASICYRDAAFHTDERGASLGKFLEDRLRSDGPILALEIDAIALLIGTHVLRRYTSMASVAARLETRLSAQKLETARDYIFANLHTSLRLADIAQTVGMSQYHFARAFRGSTGTSPHRYITRLRIQRAQELLREAELPLSQLAPVLGFVDQSHFTTAFRTAVGTTPAKYRKSHQS